MGSAAAGNLEAPTTSRGAPVPRRQYDLTLPDLSGSRAVVTGASDGMGLGMAAALAGAGAEVLVPVRNRAKGEAAVERVRDQVPVHQVDVELRDSHALSPCRHEPARRRAVLLIV